MDSVALAKDDTDLIRPGGQAKCIPAKTGYSTEPSKPRAIAVFTLLRGGRSGERFHQELGHFPAAPTICRAVVSSEVHTPPLCVPVVIQQAGRKLSDTTLSSGLDDLNPFDGHYFIKASASETVPQQT